MSEADGTTGTTGGNGIFTAGGGSPGRATFNVVGEGGQAFSIASDATVVANGITINLHNKSGKPPKPPGDLGTPLEYGDDHGCWPPPPRPRAARPRP